MKSRDKAAQNTTERSLRACYFGTYRAKYSRNLIMIEGLRINGVEVLECHEQLWKGTQDRVQAASGGWWMPLLASRQNNVPPLNYTSEQGPRPDYHEWINQLTAEIQAKGVGDPTVIRMLRQRGVTHVYIGQRNGRVNYGGPDVLNPQELSASPNYRRVYQQDRVWVYELSR